MSKMFKNLKKAAADTFGEDIKMIDVSELHASVDNFFGVGGIEEFAQTILGQGGVKENLIVTPHRAGGYEIVSGHRRTAAVRYLLEKGETVSRLLPCYVANYDGTADKMLDLVLMNVSARTISDSELMRSYEVVNEILQMKKALGEKFGKVRDRLAEMLRVSKGQVSRIQNIDNNAVPEVKKAVKSGGISINTAAELARLPDTEQAEIIGNVPANEITPRKIKEHVQKGNQLVTFSGDETDGDENGENQKSDQSVTFPESETAAPDFPEYSGIYTSEAKNADLFNVNFSVSESCFDVLNDSPRSGEIVREMLAETGDLEHVRVLNALLELVEETSIFPAEGGGE